MIDLFRDLEERLMQPDIRRSPDEAGKLLAANFTEFGSSGRVFDRMEVLDALVREAPMELSASDFAVRVLCDRAVLVTYRCIGQNPDTGQQRHSLRSSIWELTAGRWQLTFHQGTPTRQPSGDA